MKLVTRISLPILACLAFFNQTTPAQNIESQSVKTSEAITVFASRFEEKISDATPQTIIITNQEIQRSGANNISEILSKTAGLPTRINLDGSTNAVIDMRGYGDTADNNVVILLDGIRLSENEQSAARTSMIPIEAIDHLEITRGGNSVLYGDGATSGTINIITKKVTGKLTVASAGIASYNGYQSNIYHSQQIGKNDISIFARQYASDNYRDNSRGNEQSAGINWTNHIDPQTNVGMRIYASRERNKLPGALPLSYLNTSPRNAQVPDYQYEADVDSSSITLFGTKKIGDVEFAIDLSQRIKSTRDVYSYDAQTVYSAFNHAGWTQSYGDASGLTANKFFNPRMKVNDFLLRNNTLQFGYDWNQTEKTGSGYKTSSGSSAYLHNTIEYNNYDFAYRTDAFYLRNSYDITNSDQILIGYRSQKYTQTKNLFLYDSYQYTTPTNYPWISKGKSEANELQYTKKISSQLTSYARYGQNFRIPNVDDNSGSGLYDSTTYETIYLKPQISHDFDLGISYQFENFLSQFSLYSSRIKNEIGYVPDVGNINYDPTKREGFNLRQSIGLTKNIHLGTHLQYVDASFTSGSYKGNQVPNVAKFSGTISLDYRFNFKESLILSSRFADSKYMSGDLSNNQPKSSGYIVEDLSYSYKEKNWSIVSTLTNIMNKHYTDSGIYKSSSSYYPLYKLTVYPNPGRSFAIMGRYYFD